MIYVISVKLSELKYFFFMYYTAALLDGAHEMVQLLSCVDSKFTFLAVSIYDRNMFYSIVYRSSEKQKKCMSWF